MHPAAVLSALLALHSAPDAAPSADTVTLEGAWQIVRVVDRGRSTAPDAPSVWLIRRGLVTVHKNIGTFPLRVVGPDAFDVAFTGTRRLACRYRVGGDTLYVCVSRNDETARPAGLVSTRGQPTVLWVFKRLR